MSELNVDIKPTKTVNQINYGDKDIKIIVILIKHLENCRLKNGKNISKYLAGDETGSVECCFFEEVSENIKDGDVLYLTGAYCSLHKKHIVLYQARQGYGYVYKINEFFFPFSLKPNISEKEINDPNNQ